VVNELGEQLEIGPAFIRAVSILISLLPLGLGFLWALWDPAQQTWHDKIAGTYVIKTEPE